MSHDVSVKIGTENSALNAGLAAAQRSVEEFKEHTEEGFRELGKEFASAFAVGAILEGVHSLLEEFSKIADEAKRLDTTPEVIQRIAYAAKLCGTNTEAVQKGLEKVRYNAEEALGGNEKLAAAFEKLGINLETFFDLNPVEQMLLLSKANEEAEHSALELGNAYKDVLGKGAYELLPMLKEGPDELKKIFDSASVASDEMVAKLKEDNDKIESFWMNFKAVAGSALAGTIEIVEDLFGALNTLGTFLANLPDGFKAAMQASDDFSREFFAKRKEKEEQARKPKTKTNVEEIKARAGKEDKAKEEEEIAKEREKNNEKEYQAHLRTLSLQQKQLAIYNEIETLRGKLISDPLEQEQNRGKILDAQKELEGVNKEMAHEEERHAKEKFEKAKKAEEARVKGIITARKEALKDSEKGLSDLEKEKKFSVDDLRKVGGGVSGANYQAGASKDELIKQQVAHAKESVEVQKKILEALEKREQQIQSYDGGFST